MYPNGESIGIVFNRDDLMLAQLAFEKTQANLEAHTPSGQSSPAELCLPTPDEEGLVTLDKDTARQVVRVAEVAFRAADQSLWQANNLYLDRRHNKAEPEELQVISMEIESEKENIKQFEELYKNAEACLFESEGIFIEKNRFQQ